MRPWRRRTAPFWRFVPRASQPPACSLNARPGPPSNPCSHATPLAGTARQSLPASHTCPSRPAHQSALVTWSIRPPDDDLLDGLRRLQTPPRSRSWLHWLEEVPNASGPKKNPPTEERVRNGAHYAKKHVFGPVLEVEADLGEFLESLCGKSGGTPAAAAQSALAPAPAPHNRDQKIIDF